MSKLDYLIFFFKKRYKINFFPIDINGGEKLICPRCSNSSKDYFVKKGDRLYCRKCSCFIGKEANRNYGVNKGSYKLRYSLTKEQKEASEFILGNIRKRQNCALNAVCGAGKTEIIYDSIEYCLNNKKRIGIAIPRKDVVEELKERISKDFNVSVIAVYGGNNKLLEGDIIVFTTHQAFRYMGYFDVLIIDEVDAFPFRGNDILKNIVSKCSKVFVYLSATMPSYIEKDSSVPKYYLNKRYHGKDIPVPKCKVCFLMLFTLKRLLNRYKDKVVFVYFPTIKMQTKFSKKINYNYLINSRSDNRKNLLKELKQIEKGVVLTTTVLERGITIKDVQVIVYNCEHKLFDKDTLVQISGRVGRHKDYCSGDVIFLCKNKSKSMKKAIGQIKRSNG